MHPLSKQELSQLFSQVASHLAQYEMMEATLRERIRSIEREFRDRARIMDHFALISETDTRGIITYANSKFCEVSGYALDELVGKPHNIVRHPDMPKSVFKELWDTIKAGKIWQGEIKNRRKDGSAYWVLATVGPLLDAEGHPYRYISMRVDITRQKELEARLRLERDRLAQDLFENLELAQAIQAALFPRDTEGEKGFQIGLPHFVFWRPLQVVSGDFFWAYEEQGRVLIFVGDSVGHGMAGGIVSTLFFQELRHQVVERGIWSPERLAEELDERLGYLFRRKLPIDITIDGTILLIDKLRMKVSYISLRGKGALARKGEIIPLERHPFSFGDLLGQTAREHTINLEPGDTFYLYSDGISDQMNAEGKKFGAKRVEVLLQELQQQPFDAQRAYLERVLSEWQGGAPQTDDILFLGLRIV
ncbi:MAG: PAS domain S-box protein [Bacteroidia bacterium]|nr:PAS domain S-box protein [Bacteroidia bacterium]MCX7764664.1 PAS domain S-box protein [Bacteroidia bacterium]MDW8056783.1 PAS domain S-box protein [Bacteroidia bacterium]